ncbi:hypothetical protein [Janthinobacterium sp.]|uniref:hypothetical protein n=1 Tax=Janthinobacterium sp. TaxID=1871054 RepID=UPI0025C39E11|nr:hypothetical protein [Janthinobacterium sp.]NBV19943.1 hypothetical protein [Janthinobacterium sp.]
MAGTITRTQAATANTPGAGYNIDGVGADRRPYSLDDKGVFNVLSDHADINYLRNSGWWFAQRQAPGTLTTYSNVGGRIICADGWGISNENASTQYRRVDTSGAKETGLQSRFWGEFTKITSTGKIAVCQVIEGQEAMNLRGRTVRFQTWAKAIIGTPISLKIGVMSWSGTVDSVPNGAGLMWSAFGANGVDPTLAASFAWLAPKSGVTPDNATASTNAVVASATTTWQRFGMVCDVPDTCKNLIVVVWSDNQVIATNGFGLAQCSLTDGYEVQDWSPMDSQRELVRVQRYYVKTFDLDTLPNTNVGAATGAVASIIGKAGATALASHIVWRYPTTLVKAATTITQYNPEGAGNAPFRTTGTTPAVQTASATANSTSTGVVITSTGDAAGAVGDRVHVHLTADAEL